jgi:5-(carboxyamino)imidazole ribonucleotide mutase
MPGGVPVATVAVNGAKNAGILAAQMIGIKSVETRKRVKEYKTKMLDEVQAKIDKLEDIEYKEYLKMMGDSSNTNLYG